MTAKWQQPNETELRELIATLREDLSNRPEAPEFEQDFEREMMVVALEAAERKFALLTAGEKSVLGEKHEDDFYKILELSRASMVDYTDIKS